MLLLEPLLPVDAQLISVYLLQGELLLPAGEEHIFLLLPSVDSCSGGDTELIKRQRGPPPKPELVLLLQKELLLSVVHALWLPRELLLPVEEQLLSLQGRELPPKSKR